MLYESMSVFPYMKQSKISVPLCFTVRGSSAQYNAPHSGATARSNSSTSQQGHSTTAHRSALDPYQILQVSESP